MCYPAKANGYLCIDMVNKVSDNSMIKKGKLNAI